MNEVNVRSLKQYLKQRSKDELIGEIADLFAKFEPVREYYQVKLNRDDDQYLREKYREIIKHEFFPDRGFGKLRLSVAKKAISDYKKVSESKEGLADLMLYYVEMGVAFTEAYGDIDEPFYNSVEGMYERVVEFVFQHGLQDQFQARCRQIVDETRGMGWGFHDGLSQTYGQYFGRTVSAV